MSRLHCKAFWARYQYDDRGETYPEVVSLPMILHQPRLLSTSTFQTLVLLVKSTKAHQFYSRQGYTLASVEHTMHYQVAKS